ncbi:MAG TPA: MarR family transcriptional regulator [Candidatus Saccharimonadales bacterium]|nr:MarR family transcriptional regulator [Candidatus Saccharimonadales bacterium]
MENAKLDNNVYWMLVQVATRAKHGLIKLAESHDLTVVQMQTLGVMQPGEPIPMNMVSCFLACDASNVTGIVDRLLAQGYIQRQENPQDRREKMISLTSRGTALRQEILVAMADYELPEFKRLNETQLGQLKAILAILLDAPAKRK